MYFWHVPNFANVPVSFVMSARPHGTTRLSLDGLHET